MVRVLRASGSDFCVGNLRRLRHGELQRIIWSRTVHRQDRIGTTIEEFPAAMQDIIACNRMFRTAFWRDRVGDFRGGIAYEDHVPMLTAYVRARRFDVLQKVTYHWRIREDLTSTGQQKARIGNLRDRIAVKEEARQLLEAEASESVYAAWVGRALEVDLPPFLPFALTGDDEYRALLAATYRTFLDRVTPAALEQVRVAMRVRAHLAAQERWADLFDADDWLRQVQNMPPTTVVDGRLVAAFPDTCAWADALPPDQRWMAPLECHLEGAVEHLAWTPEGLRLTGWVWLRGLDMDSPTLSAWLTSSEERLALPVRRLRLPEADVWSPLSFASPAEGGFETVIDVAALRRRGHRSWALVLRMEQDGLVAEDVVHHRIARSAAAGRSVGDGAAVRWDGATGFNLAVRGDYVAGSRDGVREVVLEGSTLVATIDGGVQTAELVTTSGPVLPARASASPDGGSRLEIDVLVEGLAAPSGTYALVVDGRPMPLGLACAGSAPHRLRGEAVHVEVGQRPDGRGVFVLAPPLRDDEVGQVNRRRQVQRYRDATAPVTETVLLGSAGGRNASGDQLAIDRWLAEHRPDVQRVWGVADYSVAVPEGAERVLRGSREWYAALASARLACHDEDLGPWVSRRAGQRLLRTFPTHPFEPAGVGLWRREGLIEHLVNREVHHRHREWDVVLAPDDESAEFLRESFRWQGEVLVAGSPRTDHLVDGDRAAARERVLQQLGIPDTTLVLHAPAARDAHDVARDERRLDLDVTALARELGKPYTVLRRTDPDDRRPPPDLTGAVDVSNVADLADLLLACDVAVLDYSGLRFDWALTGRPAIFHVPDLDAWSRNRTTAFSWKESAPGPRVQTLAGVVACVRDTGPLETAYAEQVSAFNARFNALNDGHATGRVVEALLE
jgi:CDP-glycerol glycerophosphotransferase (TagB/SpsB family)